MLSSRVRSAIHLPSYVASASLDVSFGATQVVEDMEYTSDQTSQPIKVDFTGLRRDKYTQNKHLIINFLYCIAIT